MDSAYVTDLLAEHAIDFMKKQNANNEQFYVYLSHKGVHDNFSPAIRHKGCYQDKEIILPPSFNMPKYGIKELPTIDKASGKNYYGENMMPHWVKNQCESWHGVDYSYHVRPWDVQVRNYCETLRGVDDSIGSIMDYLGLNKAEQMVGYSFIPLLKGEKPHWRERIFYEYYWEHEFPQTPTMHGVRTDQYK